MEGSFTPTTVFLVIPDQVLSTSLPYPFDVCPNWEAAIKTQSDHTVHLKIDSNDDHDFVGNGIFVSREMCTMKGLSEKQRQPCYIYRVDLREYICREFVHSVQLMNDVHTSTNAWTAIEECDHRHEELVSYMPSWWGPTVFDSYSTLEGYSTRLWLIVAEQPPNIWSTKNHFNFRPFVQRNVVHVLLLQKRSSTVFALLPKDLIWLLFQFVTAYPWLRAYET